MAQAAAIPGVDAADEESGGVVLTTRQPAEVLTRLAADNRLAGLQVTAATLEDVFLDVTGREYRA
ncbi:ABC transporter related (fragment) [metagenome]|uniref:ABC transporter related n=1 Tax=metagenome TaxID=256318 RepID=A0A2P2CC78_9ZZZZ